MDRMKRTAARRLLLPAMLVLLASQAATGGTWTPLTRRPSGSVGLMVLLSDGTVLAQNSNTSGAWYRLTPDSQGHYVNGTWSTIQPMINTRLYCATQVLKDGRLFMAGGEYGTGKTTGEVYNPLTNTWTATPAPGHTFSDANSEILPDGRVLVALVEGSLKSTLLYDPAANTWANGPSSIGIHNESVWVKLPDDSILMVDRLSTSSERYIPSLNQWVADATVPVALYDSFGLECGGGFLLPNGKIIMFGATGHTAIYTPSGNTSPGSWVAGPDFPNGTATPDAPAALLPNGKVLCAVSPIPTSANHFPSPTTFYEYDYVTNTFAAANTPPSGTLNHGSYYGTMLVLPDGTALYSQFATQIYSYQFDGSPLPAAKPAISAITSNGDGTFHLTGTQLNGISEGSVYGDDNQNATNYPIIRLTAGSGTVFYAQSYNWSSTSVATGAAVVSTEFSVPAAVPAGTYAVSAIANGVASDPVNLTLGPTANTLAATGVTATAATLHATVNPNGLVTTAKFQSGLSAAYGTDSAVPLSPDSGSTSLDVSFQLTGLQPGTTYHFRISAGNSLGTADGSDLTFTTLSTDAGLLALSLDAGSPAPAFSSNTTAYSTVVPYATASVTVTATASGPGATLQSRVNGGAYSALSSGQPGSALPLNVGANTIDVLVTAQDGVTQRTYAIAITRNSSYQDWAAATGLIGANTGPLDDLDGDGIPNFLEWSSGTDASVAGSATLAFTGSALDRRGGPVTLVRDSGSGPRPLAVFLRRKDAAANGLSYTVQFSVNLSDWITSTEAPLVEAGDVEVEAVSVPYPAIGGQNARFFRVTVTGP